MSQNSFLLVFAAASFTLAACGGSSSSPSSSSSDGGAASSKGGASTSGDEAGAKGSSDSNSVSDDCAGVTELLCDRAGACGAGKVIVSAPGATAEHQSVTDCKNYYQYMQCGTAQADWAACKSAIEAAACTTTKAGESIPLPAECKGLTL